MDTPVTTTATTNETAEKVVNVQKFTANAKKVVELSATIDRLSRELKAAKSEIVKTLSEGGVREFERGTYRALLTPKTKTTLQADLVESLLKVKITPECYKRSDYVEVRVRAIA